MEEKKKRVKKGRKGSLEFYFKKRPKPTRTESTGPAPSLPTVPAAPYTVDAFRGLLRKSWLDAIGDELNKRYFRDLSEFLQREARERMILPEFKETFNFQRFTEFEDSKVVIIGQDPYPTPGNAHGFCFSVKMGVRIPASLRNIYKELSADIDGFKAPSHGNLESWAKQGVILLNAVLTCASGVPNSHKGRGWEKFTARIIETLSQRLDHLVFFLWGNSARRLKRHIRNQGNHLILETTHPSPLSANRGFLGCGHFSKANAYLREHKNVVIDWNP